MQGHVYLIGGIWVKKEPSAEYLNRPPTNGKKQNDDENHLGDFALPPECARLGLHTRSPSS